MWTHKSGQSDKKDLHRPLGIVGRTVHFGDDNQPLSLALLKTNIVVLKFYISYRLDMAAISLRNKG